MLISIRAENPGPSLESCTPSNVELPAKAYKLARANFVVALSSRLAPRFVVFRVTVGERASLTKGFSEP